MPESPSSPEPADVPADVPADQPAIGLAITGQLTGPVQPRARRVRDRHGRGMRGRPFGDTPLAPGGIPARRTTAEHFDAVALRIMHEVVDRWTERLGDVELAVEEVPVLPDHWDEESVPLAAFVDRTPTGRPRLVLFRRPLEHRVEGPLELEVLLLTVITEQVAEVLGIPAEDVHPGYEAE
ncbi:MAG: Possibl zinc metallo-peptidase [Marmoricola sp.]|nr:Possibl zinc metallo-peptidase [Marmoricola sp.]